MTLEHNSRLKFLRLLGYSRDELQKKVDTCLKSDSKSQESPQPEAVDLKSDRALTPCTQVWLEVGSLSQGRTGDLPSREHSPGPLTYSQ